jgi:hypothetical protein
MDDRRVLRWCITVVVTACSYSPTPVPGGTDATPENCFGSIVTVCPVTPPTEPTMFGGSTMIDTTGTGCIVTEPAVDACVIAGTEIAIATGVTVRGVGGRPLVLLSTGTFRIDGTLDVASRRGDAPGAGADPAVCGAGTPPSNGTTIAFGGGHGGAFGNAGGSGGPGDPDGNGGIAPAVAAFSFHGGCPGQTGGNSAGRGGSGGGAVALIATSIEVTGSIHASGAGGDGSAVEGAGGSGGGSGGAIVLDATAIDIAGLVLAHGGGGGEGSGGNVSDPGDDPATATVAVGGSGNSDGGDGGAGGTAAEGANGSPPSANPAGPSGGGGGGGGCGVIRATTSPTISGTVSPSP